ncbi:MAG TPA: hypothetical protein VIY10_06510 [Solirubrobacteraceae bacterium]
MEIDASAAAADDDDDDEYELTAETFVMYSGLGMTLNPPRSVGASPDGTTAAADATAVKESRP